MLSRNRSRLHPPDDSESDYGDSDQQQSAKKPKHGGYSEKKEFVIISKKAAAETDACISQGGFGINPVLTHHRTFKKDLIKSKTIAIDFTPVDNGQVGVALMCPLDRYHHFHTESKLVVSRPVKSLGYSLNGSFQSIAPKNVIQITMESILLCRGIVQHLFFDFASPFDPRSVISEGKYVMPFSRISAGQRLAIICFGGICSSNATEVLFPSIFVKQGFADDYTLRTLSIEFDTKTLYKVQFFSVPSQHHAKGILSESESTAFQETTESLKRAKEDILKRSTAVVVPIFCQDSKTCAVSSEERVAIRNLSTTTP